MILLRKHGSLPPDSAELLFDPFEKYAALPPDSAEPSILFEEVCGFAAGQCGTLDPV